MGGLISAVAGAAVALAATSTPVSTEPVGGALASANRQGRFLHLLRTYAERPPRETLAQVERLVEDGDFPDRARAEHWLGSAWLALQDREAARRWFARVGRDHPGSAWVERSWLGLGDAAAQEHRYGLALDWYAKAQSAHDPAVREMGRLSAGPARTLRARQRWAWAAGAFAVLVAVLLGASLLGHTPVRLWPLPAEARIVLPVLGVLALLSLRQDPAPRAAVLELCAGASVLVVLSGLRLRAAAPRPAGRTLHAAGTLAALFALAYLAVYRGELLGMLFETLRGRPE